MTEPAQRTPRIRFFTPLRYPGGKSKLSRFVKSVLDANSLLDGEYAEPYAGGAAVALELLFHEYVSKIYINDVSRPVHAFWKSVLSHTDALCQRIVDTPVTVTQWDKQRKIFKNQTEYGTVDLGFATFFLNRTNRSGILNGGIIGGRDQSGPWKIDARFNTAELVKRIQAIAKLAGRIRLSRQDALVFLEKGFSRWPEKTLIYLDPPYYRKGRDLYYDFYEHTDHEKIAHFLNHEGKSRHWIASYDNVAAIRRLYKANRCLTYSIGYSARNARRGSEIILFSDRIKIPNGPVILKKRLQIRMRKTIPA